MSDDTWQPEDRLKDEAPAVAEQTGNHVPQWGAVAWDKIPSANAKKSF